LCEAFGRSWPDPSKVSARSAGHVPASTAPACTVQVGHSVGVDHSGDTAGSDQLQEASEEAESGDVRRALEPRCHVACQHLTDSWCAAPPPRSRWPTACPNGSWPAPFASGDRLREAAIATELGVARNTIREAVRILELGGLVRYEVNRGAVVISPTPDNVEALYAARERLETAALARTPNPQQLAAITAAFDALVTAADSHDARRIVDHDLAFHSAIVALLDSSRLDEFYAELTQELRFYLMVLSVEDREFENPGVLLAEHEAILAAIRSGDRDRAVVEVRALIETNAQRLKEILAEPY